MVLLKAFDQRGLVFFTNYAAAQPAGTTPPPR
jgi:pyridoxine/pyridoxamine 5'-phosphate oxidase